MLSCKHIEQVPCTAEGATKFIETDFWSAK